MGKERKKSDQEPPLATRKRERCDWEEKEEGVACSTEKGVMRTMTELRGLTCARREETAIGRRKKRREACREREREIYGRRAEGEGGG